ncbi:MAG: MaoC family dehydratase [Candidatus Binatia bacterium]
MSKGKSNQGNFFEDFVLGREKVCATPRVIGAPETTWHIATTNDRTPRFCGAEGRVNPIIVYHVVIGQTVRDISLNANANLGYAGMVWRTPVFHGDEITTSIEIVGLKENSNRERGVVYVRTTGRNQRGETVLEYTRWVMVPKRDESKATPYLESPVVPKLPPQVTVDQLPAWSGPLTTTQQTGGPWFFEDYAPGERIFHRDGMTVNHSDHASYTRVWQNSAKVHFDAVLTDGRPLVYGGFPLAVAYAEAFNGIENRSGVVAMNSGAHANPCYAGTTIYAFTEVLETHSLGDASPYGALRLRLVGVKDADPADEPDFQVRIPDGKGGTRYNSRVLLDMDHWELMPKRDRG